MRKDIIQTGKTEEEAINSACLLLGVPRDECEWEILERARTSFFGLRKVPAKVRVWRKVDEREVREQPKSQAAPIKEQTKPTPKVRKEPKKEQPIAAKPAAKVEKAKPVEKSDTSVDGFKAEHNLDLPDYAVLKVIAAKDYVDKIIKGVGVDAYSEVRQESGSVWIAIYGKTLGVLIGRRGDTLNAIQYLTTLTANRLEGDYLRITVDCGDYRKKRNESLEEMAEKAVSQVKRTDISKTLEPMNPAERRIIHSTVSKFEGVSSFSVGNEPYRRVVVKTPTSKNKPDRRRSKPRRPRREDRPRSKPRDDREKRETTSSDSKSEPIITPETKAETPLYGKIDLE